MVFLVHSSRPLYQMGSLSKNNSVTNISRLGPFIVRRLQLQVLCEFIILRLGYTQPATNNLEFFDTLQSKATILLDSVNKLFAFLRKHEISSKSFSENGV
jgi:hypothetical protein